jgi:autotransporter-associated beta strand protein
MLFSSSRRYPKAASARSQAKPTRRPPFRPRLEALEERLAPATRVWDGGSLVDSNWTTAANWVGDVAPLPGVDALEFPSTAARKTNTNNFVGAAFLGLAFTGSGYTLGGNPVTLGGDLTASPRASSDFINLALTLSGDRTFQLGAGSVLTVNGAIGDTGGAWGFTKAGTGILTLRGANTYAGTTQVSAGSIRVEHPSALGSTAGGTVIAKGAALRLVNIPGPVVFPPEPLTFGPGPAGLEATLVNSLSDATWTGPVIFEPGGNHLVAEPTRTLRFTGPLGGAGGFRHIQGGGVLEFAGTAPNTYAGLTQFSSGILRLNKPAGVTAIPGALTLGSADPDAGVVILLAAQQIADSAAVTFAGGGGFFGTLNLNGFAETVGSLSGTGGHILLGGGVLTTGADNTSSTFGGDVTGTGSLTKVGTGTFTLTGASTYTGPTTVSAGELRVTGSIASAVTVTGSGTLSGSGTTGGVTAAAGVTVSPGAGPGVLTAAGSVALGAGSIFVVELNGTAAGSGYDQLRVTGAASTVSLGGTLSVQLGFAPAGQSFTILDNGGSSPVAGTFSGLAEGAWVRVGPRTFRISYRGGDGNDVVLTHLEGAVPGDLEWVRQFGSGSLENDSARAVAADGNVYVAGFVGGALPGQASRGGGDAFVRKYDASSTELWTRQFGTDGFDIATGVAVDASGVYVFGVIGSRAAFVRKYDADGNELWTRQFGTSGAAVAGVAVDASGVYVVGDTRGTLPGQTSAGGQDAFVRRYDADGNELWTRQFGTRGADVAFGVAVDASGVYVAGFTEGTLPGQTSAGFIDAFVRKYAADGNELWTRQFGTGGVDRAVGVAVDASGVYVAGFTEGTLPGQASAGGFDAFVRRYDAAGNELWTRQFGSSGVDAAVGVAVDASGVYVVGRTDGTLPGQTSAGGDDAFVRRYDADGNERWTRQFGTSGADVAVGVAVDASGVYVVGFTDGTLPGQASAGDFDAFVRKYDTDGNELGTLQFGTFSFSSEFDSVNAVAADGNVYVAGLVSGTLPGQTSAGGQDAFVRKYDAAGNELWTRQFGASGADVAVGVAVDASGVYVAGITLGTLPGQTSAGDMDAFVRKYDFAGNELWTRQFGSISADAALGVAVDASGVYVAGNTFGILPGQTSAGRSDVFVRKYDFAGNELWTRQFGTSDDDVAFGVSPDASGVYVVGDTRGTLPGQASAGGFDAFVRRYDAHGNELWTRQFGTNDEDVVRGVAVDAGNVFVAGQVGGTLPGQASAGGFDAFVRKYDADGNELWTRQFGSSDEDGALGVAADASGVHVVGDTRGTLPGQASAGGTDAFVRTYDADGNELWTLQFGSDSPDGANGVAADASGVYVAGSTGGTLPSQFHFGGIDAFVAKIVDTVPSPLIGSGGQGDGPGAGPALTPEQLAPLVAEALDRWQAAGVSTAQLDALRQLPVQIAPLPAGTLGWATAAGILISPDAGGYGWFVDPTPWADEEFGIPASPAQCRMDLLTVVAHEMGHALGLPHSHSDDHDVMAEALAVGVRRTPRAHDAGAAQNQDPVPGPFPSGLASLAAVLPLPDGAGAAAWQGLALRSSSASSAPKVRATAMADPLASRLVPEPFTAAQPGSEAGRVQEPASPWLNRADRVLGELAGSSLDEALLDELALSLQQPTGDILMDRALGWFRTAFPSPGSFLEEF